MTEIGEGEKFTRRELLRLALLTLIAGGLAGVLLKSTEKTEKDFKEIGYWKGKVTVPTNARLRRLPIVSEAGGEPDNFAIKGGFPAKDLEIENPKVVEASSTTRTKVAGKEVEGNRWLKFKMEIKGEEKTVYVFEPATKIDPEAEFIEYGNE